MNGLLGPLEQELLLVLPPALDVASRPAILGEDGCDYAGLWDRVSATAGQLVSFGVGPGQPVVVWLPKGTACMASILSVLRAGACYVPVDVTQPMTRVEVILDDVEPSAIITAPELAGLLGPRWSGLVVEPCDRATGTRPSPDPKLEPEDLAAILYTSGSTGRPKGVCLTHRNVSGFVRWCMRVFEPTPEDRFVGHASVAFDLSTHDLFVAMASGASLLPVPDQMRGDPVMIEALLRRWHPTIWYSVPSALDLLVRRTNFPDDGGSRLRTVLFAGEAYRPERLRELARRLPGNTKLGNLYGPTETNVCLASISNAREVLENSGQLHLEQSVDGAQVEIIGESGARIVEGGVVGEIVVTGACVSPGYRGQPKRPVVDTAGRRVHRTGDLGEYGERGEIRLHGRVDRQVQVGGHRVELGEVEKAVSSFPDVAEAAVEAIEVEGRMLLVAAVVSERGFPVQTLTLKRHCAHLLPRYMIPHRVKNLDELPRSSNGKIDHREIVMILRKLTGGVCDDADR